MKAVFITGHGGNEVVSIAMRPKPVRQPGQVLIRMQAATLNRVDIYMRNSGAGITHQLPQIMGLDGAGIVEEVTCGDQPPADIRRIFIRQLQIFGSTLGNFDEFRDLLSLTQRTGLRPVIDSEFPLDQVHAALSRLESGEQFGKIAIRIDGA